MTMASRSAEPAAKLFFLSLVACAAAALAAGAGAAGARAEYAAMTLTVVNNCPFTVWPAVAPSSGGEVVAGGGFELPTLSHRSFPAPARPWSGRIWARTACYPGPTAPSTAPPATAPAASSAPDSPANPPPPSSRVVIIMNNKKVTLHHGGERDQTSYGVSVVDGFNVGASVTPHEGRGVCPVLGCREDLTATCPGELQLRAPQGGGSGGGVLGCKSGCEAFGTDELCCRNMYASPAPAAPPTTPFSSSAPAPRPSPTPTTPPPSPTTAPPPASSRSSSATSFLLLPSFVSDSYRGLSQTLKLV
uniref:Osmotin-like protein n=1 Tax=Ananas comosus var. bracteatus TaxID=296719 RepID=A0A6V7NG94_ANACO|nr:unnamed protein product [Ananas comosus var. bracteatus]